MVFSSPVFLFVFLPLAVVGSLLFRRRGKNVFLLFASLVFYVWGEVTWAPIFFASIVLNYAFGVWLGSTAHRRRVLGLAVVANLGGLSWFKYGNFAVTNLNAIAGAFGAHPVVVAPIHLPIGISFYTFHAISYLVDVYRGRTEPQRNFVDFGLYISLFPQLVAGPIVRYHDLAGQLSTHSANVEQFAAGARRFVVGLGKKVLIANTLALQTDALYALPPSALTTSLAWLAALFYTFQIYFDFSAYSDMAVGLGHLFGFRLPENFDYPYIATSVTEFWRRWHMSLSAFFRDYVYVPLGGNRRGAPATYRNLFIVFFLCGLWHGASWTFVVWGLYHGAFLVLERVGFGNALERLPRPFRHLYLLAVVVIGWVFFRSDSLGSALERLGAMSGWAHGNEVVQHPSLFLGNDTLFALLAAAIGATPWLRRLSDVGARLEQTGTREGVLLRATTEALALAALVLVFVASSALLASGVYNPFIYFRF
jgi:alginate O-acetyltransferase complex protein AlgI